jgi:hypothetical protein
MPLGNWRGMHLFQIGVGFTPLALQIYSGLKHPETDEAIEHLCYGLLETSLTFTTMIMLEAPFHRVKEYFNSRYFHRNPQTSEDE